MKTISITTLTALLSAASVNATTPPQRKRIADPAKACHNNSNNSNGQKKKRSSSIRVAPRKLKPGDKIDSVGSVSTVGQAVALAAVVPTQARSSTTTTHHPANVLLPPPHQHQHQHQYQAKEKPEEVTHLKVEVQELKQRIASMTQNIDDLTCLVKKIDLEGPTCVNRAVEADSATPSPSPGPGNKRKKMDKDTDSAYLASAPAVAIIKQEDTIMQESDIMPDWSPSSSNDTDNLPFAPLLPLNVPLPELPLSTPPSRETSITSVSDDAFVDDLFQVFAEEDVMSMGMSMEELVDPIPASPLSPSVSSVTCGGSNPNHPCPDLMKRIEDSLSTIPKEMHELVANKLIGAISDARPIAQGAALCAAVDSDHKDTYDESSAQAAAVVAVQAPCSIPSYADITWSGTSEDVSQDAAAPPTIPLSLAVATLKTILAEYGVSVECRSANKLNGGENLTKSLPVVPMFS